jgi:hypothetical protein
MTDAELAAIEVRVNAAIPPSFGKWDDFTTWILKYDNRMREDMRALIAELRRMERVVNEVFMRPCKVHPFLVLPEDNCQCDPCKVREVIREAKSRNSDEPHTSDKR